MVHIELSYQELRAELWKRVEEFWMKKYPQTQLTSEHIVLAWDNHARLDEGDKGVDRGFISNAFFNNKGKKGLTAIDPHKSAVLILVEVPYATVEEAEEREEEEEVLNRKKV